MMNAFLKTSALQNLNNQHFFLGSNETKEMSCIIPVFHIVCILVKCRPFTQYCLNAAGSMFSQFTTFKTYCAFVQFAFFMQSSVSRSPGYLHNFYNNKRINV